jgi:diguanylate cyclase (GGDEF)-like protein
MKTVRDLIRRPPVWVNPDHSVESAIILMRGHHTSALPVLEGDRLVGLVTDSRLLGMEMNARVGEAMIREIAAVQCDAPVREAAEIMARTGQDRLPVLEGERLAGLLASCDLLPELGRSFDPLTGLPWADALRSWAIARLRDSIDVTILFFDLDDFGKFNKTYGHIVGDQVLTSVSAVLMEHADPDTDLVCRYGGDEFCIGTLRRSEEAATLAQQIVERIAEIRVEALGEARITCSYGQRGGRRTREREHVHYAATLDNLINLASRDCTERKAAAGKSAAGPGRRTPPPYDLPRLRIAGAEVRREGQDATVEVNLQLAHARGNAPEAQGALLLEGLTYYTATMTARAAEAEEPALVAEATVEAVRRVLPSGYDILFHDVVLAEPRCGEQVVTFVGEWSTPGGRTPIAGSAIMGSDPHRAVASAVLAAVNRPLGPLLPRE